MIDRLGGLARLRCRAVREPLGGAGGRSPESVVRAASGSAGLIALLGAWAGGGALIASDPLLTLPDDTDPIAALGVQPHVTGGGDADVVGGGWFGRLAYSGPSRLAFYDHLLRWVDGTWFFEALWSDERDGFLGARRDELTELLELDLAGSWAVGSFGGASPAGHLAAVETAIGAIRAGEIYQANVCTRLDASISGSTADLFADAVSQLRPAFGAYLEEPGRQAVASFSPELFLRRRGRDVVAAPIKGTWPRVDGDTSGAEALRNSAKDAAENVMIVDLMRNDLGRVAETGSVRVSSLLDIEPHPGLWHLVSTVTARLPDGVGDDALVRAGFPPGSVTGAPKSRALDVIAAVEAQPRGTYTGAIGFASPSWGLELSVAIRTFEIAGGRIALGVGGGITAESVPMLELRECLHKATPLLAALGARLDPSVEPPAAEPSDGQRAGGVFASLLALDGAVLRVGDHLARLDRSARELFGAGLPDGIDERVRRAAAGTAGRVVVRVIVLPTLDVRVTAAPAPERPVASRLRTVVREGGLWRHKWADRSALAAHEAADTRVPLFVAADDTVLETSRGNVFLLVDDGTLVTPPLGDDLLPGVTRRAVLDLARDDGRPVELRNFERAELLTSTAFWTSSLSLAVPIHDVDAELLPRRDAEVAELCSRLSTFR